MGTLVQGLSELRAHARHFRQKVLQTLLRPSELLTDASNGRRRLLSPLREDSLSKMHEVFLELVKRAYNVERFSLLSRFPLGDLLFDALIHALLPWSVPIGNSKSR